MFFPSSLLWYNKKKYIFHASCIMIYNFININFLLTPRLESGTGHMAVSSTLVITHQYM